MRNKFSMRSTPHVFLGYSKDYCGYVCFNPTNGCQIISKDVIFVEGDFDSNPSLQIYGTPEPMQVQSGEDVSCSVLPKLCDLNQAPTIDVASQSQDNTEDVSRPSSIPLEEQDTSFAGDLPVVTTHSMVNRAQHGITKPNQRYLLNISTEPAVLVGVKSALENPIWKNAMIEEFDALQLNQTWRLVPRSDSMNVLSSKWVFKHKLDREGKVVRH